MANTRLQYVSYNKAPSEIEGFNANVDPIL